MARRKRTPNTRTFAWGIAAYVKVHGKQIQKTFPPGTDPNEIEAWKASQRISLKAEANVPARGTLAHEIDRYLNSLGAEGDRRREDAADGLRSWREAFGHRARRSLTFEECRDHLNEMRKTRAASTCNHARVYLMSLWKWAQGDNLDCPLRKVERFEEPTYKRGLPPEVLDQIFDRIPESRTKARLMLGWHTGARPAEIMLLEPEDVNLDAGYVFYRTAKDGEPRFVPLNEAGKAAARLLVKTSAWGEYARAAARTVFQRGAQRLAYDHAIARLGLAMLGIFLPPDPVVDSLLDAEERPSGVRRHKVTPYALRHTCFSQLRQKGADLADVQAIAGHKSIVTTRKYSPAVNEKLVAAMQRIDRERAV